MDVEIILNHLESQGLIRTKKITGNYMTCYCPFHAGGNERRPSCGILLKDEWRGGQRYQAGFVHCFTCGYAQTLPRAITDILKQKSINKTGLDWLRENVPGFDVEDYDPLVPSDILESVTNSFALNNIHELSGKQKVEYVSEEELSSYRYTVQYMYDRKLTYEIIDKFDIGFDANWVPSGRTKKVPCITIPVRDKEGHTLFICRRSIEGKLFNYPQGVVKPVYGLDQVPSDCSSLIICESAINALTCWVWGYPAVALLGTGSPLQVQQLKETGIKEFILCFDGDEAGERATRRMKRALSGSAIVWTTSFPPGKDVNDLNKDEFEEILANKE